MFKRLRQLRISLAAKCQILFGAAVVLIIAATLFVPWHRMEQLTEQLNERAAGALAEHAVAQHAAFYAKLPAPLDVPADASPTTSRPSLATRPSPRGSRGAELLPLSPAGTSNATARLVRFESREQRDRSEQRSEPRTERETRDPPGSAELARFESRAVSHFKRHPDDPFFALYYDRGDGTKGYRFARPLYANQKDCQECHAAAPRTGATPNVNLGNVNLAAVTTTAPSTVPFATQPAQISRAAGVPVDPGTNRIGVVSVDFPSRIDATELLLNRVFLLGAGLLAGTLAIVVFYVITTRLILQPVRVLQETAEKVSKGDLNIRSDINTGDEFQQLSETFNVMLANLQRNADQLRAVNKSLDLKLGQLAETNVALYESNRLKSEFLANVSHELRTPLNSILGFADLLKDAVAPPAADPKSKDPKDTAREAKAARYISNILHSGRNLLDLINDLLDLAKIEAGRMEIRSEPLSINDLFEGLTTILKPLAEQRPVTIATSVAPDVPILHSDPGKLQQVLYNFLSNAIKFSPEGSTIDLSASREGTDHVRISVADRGPGIDPEKQAMIFEKFRQIDGSVTRSHSGSGLGLAISKELTQLMGGSIGVRSVPNEGAIFWVVLPLRIQSGHADVRGRLVLT